MATAGQRPADCVVPEEWRASLSATAGPARSPFGSSRPIVFPAVFAGLRMSQQLSRNVTERPLYVELREVIGGAITLILGPSSSLGLLSNVSYVPILNVPISIVLFPGETLWATALAGATFTILITEVSL